MFSPKDLCQRIVIRCLKVEYFGLEKDVAALYALSWKEMHIKELM